MLKSVQKYNNSRLDLAFDGVNTPSVESVLMMTTPNPFSVGSNCTGTHTEDTAFSGGVLCLLPIHHHTYIKKEHYTL